MRNRLRYESRMKRNQEIEELRKFCHEEANQIRKLQREESSLRQERDPNTVSQLLKPRQELQYQGNLLVEEKEFHDPDTASSSGASQVPDQPVIIPSPRETLGRDSGLPTVTRDTVGNSGNILVSPAAREGSSSAIFENSRSPISSYCGLRLVRHPRRPW